MPGTKRSADDSGVATRASKNPKTVSPTKPKKSTRKGAKTAIPTSAFKAKALPLHVNLTHTPPSIVQDDSPPGDVGLIGTLTLAPSSFATGSYGWKGSKRVTVELQNTESDEKEKVQVMLTINATVVGSKQAKEGAEANDDEAKDEEAKDPEETKDEGVVDEADKVEVQ